MLSPEDILKLNTAPKTLALHLGDITRRFLTQTGFVNNSQEHHEVTRQCFDFVSNSFSNYMGSIQMLPNFKNLLDEYKFIMPNGVLTEYGKAVRTATTVYGLGIYMTLHTNGIVYDHTFVPYILERMHSDICILTFAL